MIDVNWPLLGMAVLLFEAATGGLLTANVAGAGHAAGKAGGSAIAASAKSAYATRAATLQQTTAGRWRLKAEAKAGRIGKAAGLAVWRFGRSGVAVVIDGAKAAAKAAPSGATKGREIRRRALADAKGKAARAAEKWRARRADGSRSGDGATTAGPAAAKVPDAAQPTVAQVGGGWRCPTCGYSMADGGIGVWRCPKCEAATKATPATNDQEPSASDSPERGTENNVSSNTNLDDAAEKVGVVKYLAAWDGEEGGLELIGSTLDALKDRIVKAGEANKVHDPDGVTDIAGKVDAAIQALLAAGEAIDGHAKALHQKWDSTVEHARGTGAESADELLGAH